MTDTDKVAIVTGSSRGIGAAIAQRLAQAGVRVVINSAHSVDAGRLLADQLPDAFYCQADVSESSGCAQLVEATLARWGRLDLLINNMGVSQPIDYDDWEAMDDACFQRAFQQNVLSAWHMVKAARHALAVSGEGSIINISSIAGIYPIGSSIPYAIAKAALNHLTKLLAKTLAPEIRVNAIAPGVVDTVKDRHQKTLAFRQRLVDETLLARPAQPAEIADMVWHVSQATYMTGQIVTVDGGRIE